MSYPGPHYNDSEQRYRSVVENLSEGFGILDADERFLFANPAADQIFGLEAGRLSGRNLKEFLSPEQRPLIRLSCRTDALGRRAAFELAITRRDGSERNLSVTAAPHPDTDAAATFFFFRDLTSEVALQAQLRQLQRLEAIGLLTGGVAHDFNNLITVMLGECAALRRSGALTGQALASVQAIDRAAERAAGLTQQLLTYVRRQPLQRKPLNLNETIANVSDMLRRLIGDSIELERQLAPNLPPIEASAGMVEQVLMNLVVNARDAMPAGGRITIVTQRRIIEDRELSAHPLGRRGDFSLLRVEDTGHGIPAHLLPLIFEPLFTTKGGDRGTGLGLATVQAILQQHQGWAEVESRLNHGTKFSVYFPTAGRPAATAAITTLSAPAEKLRVLLVEDEPTLQYLTRQILLSQGYLVEVATSGDGALAVWRNFAGRIDLLMTDLNLPGKLGGDELARELLGRSPNLRVIFASGHFPASLRRGWADNLDDFLQAKPFDTRTLLQTIRRVLDLPPLRAKDGAAPGAPAPDTGPASSGDSPRNRGQAPIHANSASFTPSGAGDTFNSTNSQRTLVNR